MTDDAPRIARLEQELRDERRLRDAAERRAVEQADKAETWRTRAEERTERIERLLGELDRLTTPRAAPLRALKRVRRAWAADDGPETATADSGAPSQGDGPVGPWEVRRYPHVRIAHLVADEGLRRVAEQTAHVGLDEDLAALLDADVVLIEAGALASSTAPVRERFGDWLRQTARQPVVWVGGGAPDADDIHVVAAGDPVLRPTFDPMTDTPVGRDGFVADEDADGRRVSFDPSVREQVVEAARARPVAGAEDPVAEGDRRRRYAWQHHHPGVVAGELLARVGLSVFDPTPSVAALLVSNRPEDLRRQIPAMLEQQHRPLQVHVGCHGFSSSEVAAEVDRVAAEIDVSVTDLPATAELGWCLNRVAGRATAAVLAKIDDDDHYGPGYLVDALQAMEYARADIVGRLCAFTYLEGEGRTVLRRPGGEERETTSALIGATMVFRRSAWERVPFPHRTLGEDTGFQRGVRALGGRVYVASRWEFVYRRRGASNTWRVPEEHFLAGSIDAWDGEDPARSQLAPLDPVRG